MLVLYGLGEQGMLPVNLSMVLIKRHTPALAGIRVFPPWVPAAGLTFSAGFLVTEVVPRLNG